MPPRTTFALADRQKDSCLHPSRPKRNIIQKEKAGNAPSLAHEKGHRQTDRQTHRQTTTTLIASGPPLRGDPYFVCISTTLLRNDFYHCVCQRPAARNAINTVWLDCTAEPSPRTDGLGRSPRSCVPCARGLGSAVKSNLTVFVAYVRRYTSIGLYWLPGDLAAAAKLLYDRARSADSQLSCRNRWCFASSSIFSSNVHTADGLEAVYFVVG